MPPVYRSKIFGLPFAIREELNRRLLNGQRGPEILPWLNQHRPEGMSEINADNLSTWRNSGYPDWLEEQNRLDMIRQNAERVRRELDAGGTSPLDEASLQIAAALADLARKNPEDAMDITRQVVMLKNAFQNDAALEIKRDRAKISAEALALEKEKLRMKTAEALLDLVKRQDVLDIARGNQPDSEKISALVGYLDELKAFD